MSDMITAEEAGKLLDGATPGPWTVVGDPWNRIVWSSADNRVCFMAHTNGMDDARDIATSNLVAAAPDIARAYIDTAAALTAAQAEIAALRAERDAGLKREEDANASALRHMKECGLARAQNDRLWAANLNLVAEQDALTDERDAALTRLAAAEAQVGALRADMARGAVHYVAAQGADIAEMRDHLRKSEEGRALCQLGDCRLVWVNEGDLYSFLFRAALRAHEPGREGVE